jgi:hypothetical protein
MGALGGLTLATFRLPSVTSSTIHWEPARESIAQISSSFSDPAVLLAVVVAAASMLYALGLSSLRRQ